MRAACREVNSEHLSDLLRGFAVIDTGDYLQIQNLVYRYAWLLDTGRWVELGKLFAHADLYIAGALAASHDADAVTALWQRHVRLYDNQTPRTRHFISNLMIESEDGHSARSYSYVQVVQQTRTLPLQPIITGDYLDRFVKVDGIWRFSERRIENDLFGNLAGHLLIGMETPDGGVPQTW